MARGDDVCFKRPGGNGCIWFDVGACILCVCVRRWEGWGGECFYCAGIWGDGDENGRGGGGRGGGGRVFV